MLVLNHRLRNQELLIVRWLYVLSYNMLLRRLLWKLLLVIKFVLLLFGLHVVLSLWLILGVWIKVDNLLTVSFELLVVLLPQVNNLLWSRMQTTWLLLWVWIVHERWLRNIIALRMHEWTHLANFLSSDGKVLLKLVSICGLSINPFVTVSNLHVIRIRLLMNLMRTYQCTFYPARWPSCCLSSRMMLLVIHRVACQVV